MRVKEATAMNRCNLIAQNNFLFKKFFNFIFQKITLHGRKNSHLKPELMINSSIIPLSDSWEDTLAWERNMEVYSR